LQVFIIIKDIYIYAITFTCPKTFTWHCVSVFDKCLHYSCVKYKKQNYTQQWYKCKKFEHVIVND